MQVKAESQSSVPPPKKTRFEARPEDEADPSNVDDRWVLNDQVLVARRFDISAKKRG